MPRFVGESYPVGFSRERIAEATRRARDVAGQMRAEGSQIRFVRATYMPTDDSLLSLFEAASAELVIELGRRAKLPIERVVEAIDLTPLNQK